MASKRFRVDHANDLIRVISEHGRRFFHDRDSGRVARFELDKQGRVWFRDDYSDKLIYTHYRYQWRNFSHGGTMRSLVEMMRDYIRFGIGVDRLRKGDHRIPIGYIAPAPRWADGGDIWGYGEAAKDVREAASKLPIIKTKETTDVA